MTQRLENTEKGSKNDITELFARIKRYEEEARIDNDEVRNFIKLFWTAKKEQEGQIYYCWLFLGATSFGENNEHPRGEDDER